MRIWQVGLLGLALGIGPAWAQEPVPVGLEFQVNTYTTSWQGGNLVAVDASGDFVVVWDSDGSYGTDTSNDSVQVQRYDAEGSPVGGEFQVNTYTTESQFWADVALDEAGNFIVVWTSRGSFGTDTDRISVQGQRYDAEGNPVGGEFQVNTYTTQRQWVPEVAIDPQGNFVVVWTSYGSYGTDTSFSSIQGQLFDASGTPTGGQFQVNSYTTFNQKLPAVAVDAQGNFVVVWRSSGSYGTDTSGYSIQGQRYDASGIPVGKQFQINSHTTGGQNLPALAVDPKGSFVVVWGSHGSYGTDTSYNSIQGQRYDASGIPVGKQFQINSYTPGNQFSPAVDSDAKGNFVVVWSRGLGYPADYEHGIRGQHYDAAGDAVGGEFQVNTSLGTASYPSVAVAPDDDFVVVWTSSGSSGTDTSNTSILGQRFASPIFTDGFESGDTSAWSSAVP